MGNTPHEAEADGEGYDPLIDWMVRHGIEVTRENYLGIAYPDGAPEEWTAELEAQLPKHLQEPFDPD